MNVCDARALEVTLSQSAAPWSYLLVSLALEPSKTAGAAPSPTKYEVALVADAVRADGYDFDGCHFVGGFERALADEVGL